jgi:hypothetical protein
MLATDQRVLKMIQLNLNMFFNAINSNQKKVVIPINLNYMGSFLELLAVISDGSNRATESRCQNYFPLKSIMKLLRMSKNCWFLKEKIVSLYYHVYLD